MHDTSGLLAGDGSVLIDLSQLASLLGTGDSNLGKVAAGANPSEAAAATAGAQHGRPFAALFNAGGQQPQR
jgi:hypothetical protein